MRSGIEVPVDGTREDERGVAVVGFNFVVVPQSLNHGMTFESINSADPDVPSQRKDRVVFFSSVARVKTHIILIVLAHFKLFQFLFKFATTPIVFAEKLE